MFGKLFKHDFKAILRFGIPMLIAMAIVCVTGCLNSGFMTALLYKTTDEGTAGFIILTLLSGLIEAIVTIVIIAIPITVEVIVLVNYYKSTASDEAYLTFTLPVTPTQVLLSKLLNAVVWSFIMSLASGLATFLISLVQSLVTKSLMPPDLEVDHGIESIFEGVGGIALMITLIVIFIIVSAIASQTMCFMAISFGSAITRKNKALSSIGFLFLTNFLYGIVNYIILVICIVIAVIAGIAIESVVGAINIALAIMIGVSIIFAVLFFFLTRHTLEKKLNLA